MGVRVRLSRNTSAYFPFWVAIPFWFFWGCILLMFWMSVLAVWMMWAMVALPVAGIAGLCRDHDLSQRALGSLDWTRKGRRSRPASSGPATGAWRGQATLKNGATWKCDHRHRTKTEASECARLARAAVMAGGQVYPAPKLARNHCWYCGARKK